VADALRVSNEGLHVLAAHCDAVSARLMATTPMSSVALPIQATSGAVGAAYAALDGAIITLAGRAQATAIKASAINDSTARIRPLSQIPSTWLR
jgi:hypothetical protein